MPTPSIDCVHASKNINITNLLKNLADSDIFYIYILLNLISENSILNSEVLWSKFININGNCNR